jgi:hypothetical protein
MFSASDSAFDRGTASALNDVPSTHSPEPRFERDARAQAQSAEPSRPRWLRLVRGTASEPDRMLREPVSGSVIAVGSAASSDWQIDAADVPPLALWIRALPGGLFVRAAGSCPVTVDGDQLGTLWTPVAHGSCVSVGGAAFEIGLCGRSRAAQSERLQRAFAGIPDPLRAPRVPDPSCSAGELVTAAGDDPWLLEEDVPEQPTVTIFGLDDAGSGAPARVPALRLVPHLWTATSVLIAGGLLLCAYGCWVLLLDRL